MPGGTDDRRAVRRVTRSHVIDELHAEPLPQRNTIQPYKEPRPQRHRHDLRAPAKATSSIDIVNGYLT